MTQDSWEILTKACWFFKGVGCYVFFLVICFCSGVTRIFHHALEARRIVPAEHLGTEWNLWVTCSQIADKKPLVELSYDASQMA